MTSTLPLLTRPAGPAPTGPATAGRVGLALPGRTLLLVAGMPGAGKSTLLAGLPPDPDVVVLDSETQRAALARILPETAPYRGYRGLVHLRHRAAVVSAAMSSAETVVVHLPATGAGTRAAVARIAASTGRRAHLLWVHAEPAQARRGQHQRGRPVREKSFAGQAERATATAAALMAGWLPPGWCSATVLDRAASRRGLRLDVGPGK